MAKLTDNPHLRSVAKRLKQEMIGVPRVTLKREVWEHMELLFKSQRQLCEHLETTAKTWRDMKSEEGVRENTAQRVLLEFIGLVHKVAEKTMPAPSYIHDTIVPRLNQIYSPYLTSLKLSDLWERRNYLPSRMQDDEAE